MYIPAHFDEQDAASLLSIVEQHNFASLISTVESRPVVTHLPFLYDKERGRLLAHMARANPHWQILAKDPDNVLVVFQGPHAYISPSWYEKAGVPTWNYVAVHVYGRFGVIDGAQAHEQVMRALTEQHESTQEQPWRANFDSELVSSMMAATVAFEIKVSEWQGKFKLSQNRPTADRERVINRLSKANDDNARGIAEIMKGRR